MIKEEIKTVRKNTNTNEKINRSTSRGEGGRGGFGESREGGGRQCDNNEYGLRANVRRGKEGTRRGKKVKKVKKGCELYSKSESERIS